MRKVEDFILKNKSTYLYVHIYTYVYKWPSQKNLESSFSNISEKKYIWYMKNTFILYDNFVINNIQYINYKMQLIKDMYIQSNDCILNHKLIFQ